MFRGLLGGIRAEIGTATALSSAGVRTDVTNLQMQEECGMADGNNNNSHMLSHLSSSSVGLTAAASLGLGSMGTALSASAGGGGGRTNDVIINHDADVCRQVKILITSGFGNNGLYRLMIDDAANKFTKTGEAAGYLTWLAVSQ